MIRRDEAHRMFGVTRRMWKRWVGAGRVPGGQWVRVPGTRGRCKVYLLEELERVMAEIQKLGQPYPDPDRSDCWRVPVMSFTTTKCEAMIDVESLPLVAGKRWNLEPRGDSCAPAVVQQRPFGKDGPRRASMARVIVGLIGRQCRVVHANGDPLDCRRANLIVRDASEHNAAARKAKGYGGKP